VIIRQFDIVGVTLSPQKTETKLVVDADAMLAFSVAD
jgi:hypothetical protein